MTQQDITVEDIRKWKAELEAAGANPRKYKIYLYGDQRQVRKLWKKFVKVVKSKVNE